MGAARADLAANPRGKPRYPRGKPRFGALTARLGQNLLPHFKTWGVPVRGWQIFWQSVLRVFNNIGPAFRISAVPYIIIGIVFVLLLWPVMGIITDREAMTAAIRSGTFPWLNFSIAVLVGLVGTLWVAVGWHRYILIDETPGMVPAFRADRMVSYFLRGLLIGIILIPLVIVLGIVASLLAASFLRPDTVPSTGALLAGALVFGLIVYLPVFVIGMRLSTALPGAAIGAPKGIGDAWRATKGQLGALLVLAIVLTVASYLSDYVTSLLARNTVLALIWSIGFGWVSALVGVSILTTLYGHYIEGRALQQ